MWLPSARWPSGLTARRRPDGLLRGGDPRAAGKACAPPSLAGPHGIVAPGPLRAGAPGRAREAPRASSAWHWRPRAHGRGTAAARGLRAAREPASVEGCRPRIRRRPRCWLGGSSVRGVAREVGAGQVLGTRPAEPPPSAENWRRTPCDGTRGGRCRTCRSPSRRRSPGGTRDRPTEREAPRRRRADDRGERATRFRRCGRATRGKLCGETWWGRRCSRPASGSGSTSSSA